MKIPFSGKLALWLVLIASAFAQSPGGYFSGMAISTVNGYLVKAPNATISVCAHSPSCSSTYSSACSPLASVYTDPSLGAGYKITQPWHADANGNYQFYAAQVSSGITVAYDVQVVKSSGVGYVQCNVIVAGQGAAGAAGPATITTGTTTTGAPGTSASVSNSGTSSAVVLNFTIPAGQGINWRGAYTGSPTAYAPYDIVSYNGSTYINILASTGNLPTNATYWALLASIGATGQAGAGSGNVTNTGTSVAGTVPQYSDMTGTQVIPSTVPVTNIAQGPASAVGGNIVSFNGTGGKTLADSGFSAASINGFRNRIINGNFAINQRTYVSSTATSAGVYMHDRWKAGAGGATYTFTQTNGDTTITITAGTLQQVIENVNLPEGGTYTLSWTGTAQGRVGAGSYAASPITVTVLAAATSATVEFNTGTLGKVQFEVGSVATSFERRPYGLELVMCQRYYYQVTGTTSFVVSTYGSGAPVYPITQYNLPVTMRVAPTVAIIGAYTYVNCTLYTLGASSASSIFIELQDSGAGRVVAYPSSASSGMSASAEL